MQAEALSAALAGQDIESFRPLLPVGYAATAEAYREAAASFSTADLTHHYTVGLKWFGQEFVPQVKAMLQELSGGVWDFSDYEPYAAGSDVDFMAHVVNAVANEQAVRIFPGDWYGFRVGASQPERVQFNADSRGAMACLCVPSVRNGHLTDEMVRFLHEAESCLLNINLYPTLCAEERRSTALALLPILPKSIVSVSFSRGFALTGSQLGLVLVHRDHPLRARYGAQWSWFTYFHNSLAARAFLRLDTAAIRRCDDARRQWVTRWLKDHDLPALDTGSYYVRSFRVQGDLPADLQPLVRDGLARLCFKPNIITGEL